MTAQETIDARRTRFDEQTVLELARTMDIVISVKGKKVEKFDLKNDRPADATLLAALMGPTGNLRAPALRKGKTLIVGFRPEVYRETL